MNNIVIYESINDALAIIAGLRLCRTAWEQGKRRAWNDALMFLEISSDLEEFKEYVQDALLDKTFDAYLKKNSRQYLEGQASVYDELLDLINIQIDLEEGGAV